MFTGLQAINEFHAERPACETHVRHSLNISHLMLSQWLKMTGLVQTDYKMFIRQTLRFLLKIEFVIQYIIGYTTPSSRQ